MKKVLLMTLALMVCTRAAIADLIGVFGDNQGLVCQVGTLVAAPANNAFYIIHQWQANGASASQFKVNDTTGLFATSQTTPFLMIGTWNTDLSLAYGACVHGDILLMTLNFLWFGTPIPPDCAHALEVVAAPTTPIPGEVATVECDFNTLTPAYGGALFVSTTPWPTLVLAGGMNARPASCVCYSFCLCSVPVEESTWGGVKALYR